MVRWEKEWRLINNTICGDCPIVATNECIEAPYQALIKTETIQVVLLKFSTQCYVCYY